MSRKLLARGQLIRWIFHRTLIRKWLGEAPDSVPADAPAWPWFLKETDRNWGTSDLDEPELPAGLLEQTSTAGKKEKNKSGSLEFNSLTLIDTAKESYGIIASMS